MTVYTCEERLDLSARQAKALKGSIKKWEKIVNGTGWDEGTTNCPLCRLYHIKYVRTIGCTGCPIKTVTGEKYCNNTPLDLYRPRDPKSGIRMLDFLKSILEKAYVRKGKK